MKLTVLTYDAIFEEQSNGGYTVEVPSLPGCISEGDTFEEAKSNITEAITAYVESLTKDGVKIPKGDTIFVGQISVPFPAI